MILTVTLNPAIDLTLHTSRLSFDEPGRIVHESAAPGGKGINGARAIRACGGRVLALAPCGGQQGRQFEGLLAAEGLPAELIPVSGELRRNIAVTDDLGTTIKLDHTGPVLSAAELGRLQAAVEKRLSRVSWLMLTGSLPPEAPVDIYARLTAQARSAGVPVLVDTSGEPLAAALEARPSLVKPNRFEAGGLLGRELRSRRQCLKASEQLMERGAERVILSCGSQGAVAAAPGQLFTAVPPGVAGGCAVGAGDVLAATCVWALARGDTFSEALRLGVAAATEAASLPGSTIGTLAAAAAMREQVVLSAG